MASANPGPAMPGHPRSTAFMPPVAAQNDDAKYKAKYKDLKKQVKEVEMDNDKLHLKILKTNRGIQRTRMERAILLERLGALPPVSQGKQGADHRGPSLRDEAMSMERPLETLPLQELARQAASVGALAPRISPEIDPRADHSRHGPSPVHPMHSAQRPVPIREPVRQNSGPSAMEEIL